MTTYKFCPKCGHELSPEDKFCDSCGMLLNDNGNSVGEPEKTAIKDNDIPLQKDKGKSEKKEEINKKELEEKTKVIPDKGPKDVKPKIKNTKDDKSSPKTDKKRHSKLGLIILIIIVVCFLVGAGIGAYFFMSNKSQPDSTEKSASKKVDQPGMLEISESREYDKIYSFHCGLVKVFKDGKYGFVDRDFEEVIPLTYDGAKDFSEDFAAVKKDDKWGFIYSNGEELIPCIYDEAKDFSEGSVAVKKDDKWGFINKDGNEIIPFIYDEANDFSCGLAKVKKNMEWSFISRNNEELIPSDYDEVKDFTEGLAAVRKGVKWGFIDRWGNEVIACSYVYAKSFSEGLALVRKVGEWVFIDEEGNEGYSCSYEKINDFSGGLAAVEKEGKWGFINKNYEEVIYHDYDSVGDFSQGLAAVRKDGKWGFINENGIEVIPLNYEMVNDFSDGRASVKDFKSMSIIDRNGKNTFPEGIRVISGPEFKSETSEIDNEELMSLEEEFIAETKQKDKIEPKKDDSKVRRNKRDKVSEDLTVVKEQKEEIFSEPEDDDDEVFKAVEQMPQFPGGQKELLNFLTKNIRYPVMASENNIQGRVIIQFVVTKTGSIGNVRVVKSVDRDLDNEAVRLVKTLPKFIPGKMCGKAVNVWFTLPVTFKLQ